MATRSASRGSSGIAGVSQENQQHVNADGDASQSGEEHHTQDLHILIFKGQPRDIQSTRVTNLQIKANDANQTRMTFQLDGSPGNYWVDEQRDQPSAMSRPNLVRKLHIATVQTTTPLDMNIRDVIMSVPMRNDEPDWNCQNWVGDVIDGLRDAGLITSDEAHASVDAMVNIIFRAPPPPALTS
ncbi:uncharacterized protein BCR38DRAFT_485769 [Pseudomassariella vexata]|uniref:Uncharacterized protein n=1 Tax=Pseudomassariella vexata TaxID=1141098 RepID=A0A1Y2DWK0_9PEZI|nr:uncharacterized protein BCR38DRAFT_485769 [Pseudomassariella vexata]ORY62995.1 hypothetical protein BCR38DRAFT_485769 [Pseudomassariella vexata]